MGISKYILYKKKGILIIPISHAIFFDINICSPLHYNIYF